MSITTSLIDSLIFAQNATPWWSHPGMLGAILGSAIGVFGGVYGTLVGVLAPRGKAKAFVFTVHWAGIGVGVCLVIFALIALALSQPYALWYGTGLPGLILIAVLLPLTGVIKQRYREAEHRRLESENFRRG